MTKQVNVYEAKSQLSRLIEEVLAGEDVVIARAGTPVVDLVVHRKARLTFGVEGWTGHRHDPHVFDGIDDDIDELFYRTRS